MAGIWQEAPHRDWAQIQRDSQAEDSLCLCSSPGIRFLFEITCQFCLAGRYWCCSEEHGTLQGDAIHSRSPYYHTPLARLGMTDWASQCNQEDTAKHRMESSPHSSCLLLSSCFCSGEWSKCKTIPCHHPLGFVEGELCQTHPTIPCVEPPALWTGKKQETTYFDVNKTSGIVMDKIFSWESLGNDCRNEKHYTKSERSIFTGCSGQNRESSKLLTHSGIQSGDNSKREELQAHPTKG